jgi:hyperosmotically inducible protein
MTGKQRQPVQRLAGCLISRPWLVGSMHHAQAAFFYFFTGVFKMKLTIRTTLAASIAAIALLTTGCAVTRGQESMGAYVDDTAVTTSVKARFVDNKEVDASAISVETLNGTVMLSGFAKNMNEKATAESIARNVKGVKSVKNAITIRP